MQRVPVIDKDGKPLMPTKASRARRMVRDGKAVGKRNKLGIYYIQLVDEPSGKEKQDISVGIDAGIKYQGWCSGDTAKQVSISNAAWSRIGQFTASKVRLLRRATGLICTQETNFNVAV